MIPANFMDVPSIPLTPNGKVDRGLLPHPSRALEVRRHEAPRDNVERTLCLIWADVLGVTQIGIDDNFFELGGHSLLAAKLFSRLTESLGRPLPLATLFEASTVRRLARFYRDGDEPAASFALIPITSGGTLPPVFAVPGVGGNVLGFAELARELGPERPFYGLQSIGLDGTHEPLETIEEIAARNLAEVRQVQSRGPYHIIGACFGATVAFEMTRQLIAAGDEVAFLGLLDPAVIGGERTGQRGLPIPPRLKRALAFGLFVTRRLSLYRKGVQGLTFREWLRFLKSKAQLLGQAVRKRDAFRGDKSEFNQQRVYDSNLRALHRYKFEPLTEGAVAVEIFRTDRPARRRPGKAPVDWAALAGESCAHHKVLGRDSADMAQGDNARALALILSARIRNARKA
jgi:thioesterase domain-containing protein